MDMKAENSFSEQISTGLFLGFSALPAVSYLVLFIDQKVQIFLVVVMVPLLALILGSFGLFGFSLLKGLNNPKAWPYFYPVIPGRIMEIFFGASLSLAYLVGCSWPLFA